MPKILQINLHRSRPAHDLALQTSYRVKAGILVISEPNRNAILGRKDWTYDESLDTAIKIIDPSIVVKGQGQGPGYSFISTKDFTVYSCYSSGNIEVDALERTLSEIGVQLRSRKEDAVITGDFNAKSSQWGMPFTDRRGQIICEWIESNDLVVRNEGEKPTFTVGNYGSILDLTIATVNLSSKIVKWEVMDEESLSDHNYILFEVAESLIHATNTQRAPDLGWNVKKLDKHKLQQTIDQLPEQFSAGISASEFTEQLIEVCNSSMPRKKTPLGHRPAYWWNNSIAELRKICLQQRRRYTRNARQDRHERAPNLWQTYQESKRNLRNAIKKAKREHWKKVCADVDSDIWGNGYKIVMKGLLGYPPKINLTMNAAEEVAKELFPQHPPVVFACENDVDFVDFTPEELFTACSKLKPNKAPGPANVPGEVLKFISEKRPQDTLLVYNNLARQASFPQCWKTAKLLLIRKGDKPLGSPSSFRPICLLDVESKLFEHLLKGRINDELNRTGGLSDRQYGFRKGRQTIDAIRRVQTIAASAERYSHNNRRLCAMITIDVRNAFNSASWQLILDKLRARKFDESLINIVASYLSDRHIIIEAENESRNVDINSSVPQGSILGPTLWNILYDDLLDLDLLNGAEIIGFADDIALVVVSKNEDILVSTTNACLQRIANWMEKNKLKIAPEKTEAVLLTKKRKIGPIAFNIKGVTINLSKALKYLGVWMDTKQTFATHIDKTIQKADKTISALSRLMPNTVGPRASKRILYSSVVHSQILYASPVWYKATENKKLMMKLSCLQRRMSIRVTSAYRSISTDGVGVISGIPPINLLILERKERYAGIDKETTRNNLLQKWQDHWQNSTKGRWTFSLIPNIEQWINRKHGEVDYYITQALSGHGCFRKYLFERRRSTTSCCPYCSSEDDAPHTLFVCPRWAETRRSFLLGTGRMFDAVNMMEYLLMNDTTWKLTYATIRGILETKERKQSPQRNQHRQPDAH